MDIDSLLVKCPDTDMFDVCRIYKLRPSTQDHVYFQQPVRFVNNEEFGNDYYYYAKLRPDLALKNFGLNKITIGKDNILHYKNVNDSIDNQTHKCADSLQSQQNRDIVGSDFAFYFHGEIIRAGQVFSEIPQAKAYYERYDKK